MPLYQGDIEADIRTMNRKRAEEIGGKMSYPQKMDVASWGIPASRCRIGSVLALKEGSTCHDCYALKGTFRFKAVSQVLEDNYRKLQNVLWTPAIASQIRWLGEERFRLFMSGDVQGANHFLNIIQVAQANPSTCFWMPSREVAIVREYAHLIPPNLIVRLSAAMVDGPPPSRWPLTSRLVSADEDATCPSSLKGGSCADNQCSACWDRDVPNVAYLKH